MSTAKVFKTLSQAQQRAIRRYVDQLVEKKLKLFKTYFDIDEGLELRSEIKRRLVRGKKNQKRIPHDEFWSKAFEK